VLFDTFWKRKREEVCQPSADILKVCVLDEHQQPDDSQGDTEEVEWKEDDESIQ
jgi:hypothetical protein